MAYKKQIDASASLQKLKQDSFIMRQLLKARIKVMGILIKEEAQRILLKKVSNKATGRLARSIDVTIEGDGLQLSVGSNLAYAKHVELGTSKMRAKPFLKPALEKYKNYLNK